MAGKRGATSELNHENWDQEDDEPEVAGVFVQANADELSKRVIKKAKRRGVAGQKAVRNSKCSTYFRPLSRVFLGI